MDLAVFASYHELILGRSSTAFIPWRTGTFSAMMRLTAGRPRHDVKGNVMRGAYRILANLIALLVVVQAAAIAYAVAGLGIWVEDGGVLDKAAMEADEAPFDEVVGFMVHGMNGMMLIPLIALVLLIVSFFAKVPGGIAAAGGLLALIVLQVVLGIYGSEVAISGLLHGINALIIFGGAIHAARLPAKAALTDQPQSAPAHV